MARLEAVEAERGLQTSNVTVDASAPRVASIGYSSALTTMRTPIENAMRDKLTDVLLRRRENSASTKFQWIMRNPFHEELFKPVETVHSAMWRTQQGPTTKEDRHFPLDTDIDRSSCAISCSPEDATGVLSNSSVQIRKGLREALSVSDALPPPSTTLVFGRRR